MHQPVSGKPYVESYITIKGQILKVVEKFTCLAAPSLSLSSWMTKWTSDTQKRVQPLADSIVIWGIGEASRRQLKWMDNELSFYPTLLYGCETWTTWQRHIKKLNYFHATCLKKILSIKWQKDIPGTEVLTRAFLPSIFTILIQSRLRWASHVICTKNHRLPKKTVLCRTVSGQAPPSRPKKKRFKDTLKVSMKYFGISPNCIEYLAQDRD